MVVLKISEVTSLTGLNASTLRYYEKIGLIPSVDRDQGGIREYSREDVEWAEFIKCMRSAGLSIDSLKDYTQMYRQGDSTINARKELLDEERCKLIEKKDEIEKTIKRLNVKIAHYEDAFETV